MSCVVDRRGGQPAGRELGLAGPAGPDVVPVAQAVGDDVVLGRAAEVGDVALHALVCSLEDAAVAVHLVDVPRDRCTQALPHSGESRKPPPKTVYSGAMSGTSPLSSCASRMSCDDLGVEPRQS